MLYHIIVFALAILTAFTIVGYTIIYRHESKK
nr:hypothetical protein SPSIL_19710 [Sporomusa silvacetica DSM 10669]